MQWGVFFFLCPQTLPPIKQTTIAEQQERKRQQRRFGKKYWARPEPPKPFLLHLGVTARTHTIEDFQQNFPDEYKNFYIDRYRSPHAVLKMKTAKPMA